MERWMDCMAELQLRPHPKRGKQCVTHAWPQPSAAACAPLRPTTRTTAKTACDGLHEHRGSDAGTDADASQRCKDRSSLLVLPAISPPRTVLRDAQTRARTDTD